MPNSPSHTYSYRRVGEVLHEIGMISEEQLRETFDEYEEWLDDQVEQFEAAYALEEFGVAVTVHADDIDSVHEGYAFLIDHAVEVAGNRVTITDVHLVEGDGELEDGRDDTLRFTRDGKPVSIDAEHLSERYYDHQTACDAIELTSADDDPRSWRIVDFERRPNRVHETVMVLATPEQARALDERLGFSITDS